ncbi:cell division protein FtsL [Paratractidigestivibacter sp.]|uniref:cell division protein FtsL n=1 Tax=Paratractidigestivibacter sp. TaxID=2847316 RepID=UPI002ABD9E76|nr:cell division protein FtsL [Paratractidigestivibacter sp.]
MKHQGSEALYIDYAEEGRAFEQEAERPSLSVLTGGGLDARARKGVTADFTAKVARVLAVTAAVFAIGFVRVCVSSATVAVLTENSSLRSEVNDAKNLNYELKIERTALSSNSRIARIATQNYGMVRSDDTVSVKVGAEAADAAAPEASEADMALDPYAFVAATLKADGDAGQLVSEAYAVADVA